MAEIDRVDGMGRKLCFHSLRYTFATKLACGGVSQRLAQELMRHSDPRLTANVYTDFARLPTFAAVAGLSWHDKSENVPAAPLTQPSQLDSQSPDLGGQNLSRSVANRATISPSEPVASQATCLPLSPSGMRFPTGFEKITNQGGSGRNIPKPSGGGELEKNQAASPISSQFRNNPRPSARAAFPPHRASSRPRERQTSRPGPPRP
ncbi:MAG: tyrosine-type recombinase/integrase [Candidatus Didemnitutus sp.]|nr:tyrosine-type recombinase/integrase [Candidatus Didemnitutus sp.]